MLSMLSLRAKLSIYVGAAIAAAVTICISLFLVHAASRIRSESLSAVKLASDFIIGALPSIRNSSDPESALRRLIEEAVTSRHIRMFSERVPISPPEAPHSGRPPEWFLSLLTSKQESVKFELITAHGRIDEITIEPNPFDEISEIWDEIEWISVVSIAIALLIIGIIAFVVSKTLAPVDKYVEALTKLDEGERFIEVEGNGSPEFRIITERVNALARTLRELDDENHALIQKMIRVQDDERKELARDLHDEFGPALFMARVDVGGLHRKIDKAFGKKIFIEEWQRVDAHFDRLQQINKHTLGRLRPAALEEMGLTGAVEAMIQSWQSAKTGIQLSCKFSDTFYPLDENKSLTAYRIIQEAMTNVIRHSRASVASVEMRIENISNSHFLKICIVDDGVGINSSSNKGIGLRGMKERILSVGGNIEISKSHPSGTRIVATIAIS